MDIGLGLLFGITAMLGWGLADFLGAVAARKTSPIKTALFRGVVSIIFVAALFPLFGGPINFSEMAVVLLFVTGLLTAVSVVSYFKGFTVGDVSVISPIVAMDPIIIVLLSIFFLKESLTMLQVVAIVLAISGSALTSFKLRNLLRLRSKRMVRGINYAVLCVFGYGVTFFLIGLLANNIGWYPTILFFYLISTALIFIYSSTFKRDISLSVKGMTAVLIVGGLIDALAFLSYSFGTTVISIAIVGVVSSVYPMVTIILARIVFKERLAVNQVFGIAMILVALVLFSL